jgi:hypothetical protein
MDRAAVRCLHAWVNLFANNASSIETGIASARAATRFCLRAFSIQRAVSMCEGTQVYFCASDGAITSVARLALAGAHAARHTFANSSVYVTTTVWCLGTQVFFSTGLASADETLVTHTSVGIGTGRNASGLVGTSMGALVALVNARAVDSIASVVCLAAACAIVGTSRSAKRVGIAVAIIAICTTIDGTAHDATAFVALVAFAFFNARP